MGRSVESFFEGRTAELRLFRAVSAYILSLGEVDVEAKKSQVSFGAKRKFAWVWFPPKWAKDRPKHCIILSFGLHRRNETGR